MERVLPPVESLLSREEFTQLTEAGFALEYDADARLVLRDNKDPKLQPLAVDFLSAQLSYRREKGIGKNQPIARALGLRSLAPGIDLSVLDATAGLGTDALMMASLGCNVVALERSPVVYALLADGYRRLREEALRERDEDSITELLVIADRLRFERADAASYIANLKEQDRPDVIYLDPMYPDEGRSKSALPKKGMQIFRRLIGGDLDADAAFRAAFQKAKQRVVVKRPLRAPWISENEKPTHTFEGKTARFDMYLCRNVQT